jgi:Na+/proline symporter
VALLTSLVLAALGFASIFWSVVQRYLCVPRDTDARKAGWLAVVLSLIVPPLVLIPALAVSKLLPEAAGSPYVYPRMWALLLPPGTLGLVLAGMFAATMSLLAADINVCASVLTRDVYARLAGAAGPDRELLGMGRLTTLLFGTLVLLFALLLPESPADNLLGRMAPLLILIGASLAFPMLCALLAPRWNATAVNAGFVGGLQTGLLTWLFAPGEFRLLGTSWTRNDAVLWAVLLGAGIVLRIVKRIEEQDEDDLARGLRFEQRMRTPIGSLESDAEDQARAAEMPFSAWWIGLLTVACGVMLLPAMPVMARGLAFNLIGVTALALIVAGLLIAVATYRARRH